MGSGKTTFGQKLAKHTGLQFIDMDHYIEKRNCKTVPRLFATEGEAGFRQKEQRALHELSGITDVIIATGGGAPCFFDNMDVMYRTGITIYLDIDPEILAERLLNSKTERPLIKGKNREELVSFIDDTLKKREIYYSKAQYRITRPDVDPEEVWEMIRNDQ